MLENFYDTNLFERGCDLAQEMTRDPYNFGFAKLTKKHNEAQCERAQEEGDGRGEKAHVCCSYACREKTVPDRVGGLFCSVWLRQGPVTLYPRDQGGSVCDRRVYG